MAENKQPVVEMKNIVRRFGTVEALRGVDFEVRQGDAGDAQAGDQAQQPLALLLRGVLRYRVEARAHLVEQVDQLRRGDGRARTRRGGVRGRRWGVRASPDSTVAHMP